MTTARVIEKDNSEVKQLMRSMISSHSSLGLVRFFAAHPNGKFSKLAIVHAMDDFDSRREIEKTLAELTASGVLKTFVENKVSYYRLTSEDPVRGIVLKTAEMDWRRWQLIFQNV